jgi:hypothetical protein
MKNSLLFLGITTFLLFSYGCQPQLTMDEILSQRPPYNARNVMEFRIPAAANVHNDVVLDFVALPSTNPAHYGTRSCIDEANKIIYIDMPPHVVDSAMTFKVILGIGASSEPTSFSTLKLDSINYLTVIAESGVKSRYTIVRLKRFKYTDGQIFTASIPNVIDNVTGAPVRTSFMIGSNTGRWGAPFDAVIYLPSNADSSQLKVSLSLNTLTSYKASIFGPCSPEGPAGESLIDKNNAITFDTDGPLYDSTLIYSVYKVPIAYDPQTGLGTQFVDGMLFRTLSYSETTRKYYRLRFIKSANFDERLTYYKP